MKIILTVTLCFVFALVTAQAQHQQKGSLTQNFIAAQQANSITPTAADIGNLMLLDMHLSTTMTDGTGTYTRVIDSMGALYLFFGNTFTSQKLNFLNPLSYTLTSFGSPVSSDTGITFNGTSNYVSTNFNANTNGTHNMGLFIGIRNNRAAGGGIDIGEGAATALNSLYLQLKLTSKIFYNCNSNSNTNNLPTSNIANYWLSQRISNTVMQLDSNGVQIDNSTVSYLTNQSLAVFVGAYNSNGSPALYAPDNISCAGITTGAMSATLRTSLYNAVKYYNSHLTKPR